MFAPKVFGKTQWGSSEIHNLAPASMVIFREIFALLEQIETDKVNNYRSVWLRADRGTLEDMDFENQEDALEYFCVSEGAQLQEAFLREFPNEVYWFELESVNDRNYYHLGLRNFSITIVEGEQEGYPYAIQRLFGWQNSHLHHYAFPDEVFQRLTQNSFSRWCSLAGIYFRFPSEELDDLFWDEDYEADMSIKSWFKSKYKGPYHYGGLGDYYLVNHAFDSRVIPFSLVARRRNA